MLIAYASAHTQSGAQRLNVAFSEPNNGIAGPDRQWSDGITVWSVGVDREMRRLNDGVRGLTEERNGLTEKLGAMERRVNELAATAAQRGTQFEAEAKAARETAASASQSAAAALKLAQARQESPPQVAHQAPPATAIQEPAATFAMAIQEAQHGANGPNLTIPVGHAAIAGPPSAQTISSALPPLAAFPVTTTGSPTYTGTVPMPAPWPETAAILARAPHVPSAGSADPGDLIRHQQVGAVNGSPRMHAAVAPIFQSNPLMAAGILDAPPALGAIAAEFGVDLGAATTVEAARARWNELQIHQSPLLDNLKPLIALKDGSRGGQELHLVAGPLTSSAAGARLCAVVSSTGTACEPSAYDGQRLLAQ